MSKTTVTPTASSGGILAGFGQSAYSRRDEEIGIKRKGRTSKNEKLVLLFSPSGIT